MVLDFNSDALENLMKDFYLLTGIRMALFDTSYQQLLSYPPVDCTFCHCMKSHGETNILCRKSDQHSLNRCKEERALILYHCHAGLIEACAPLTEGQNVVGYLMLGQISDASSESELSQALLKTLGKHHLTESIPAHLTAKIPLRTFAEITAAAKIMEACTFYVIFRKTVFLRKQNFMNNMRSFLIAHLSEDLSIERLSKEFGISKSKLYEVCDEHLSVTISKYIRFLRMEKAKELLLTTDLSITEIAGLSGFSDYNYFCRVFKKETGLPAKKFRSTIPSEEDL